MGLRVMVRNQGERFSAAGRTASLTAAIVGALATVPTVRAEGGATSRPANIASADRLMDGMLDHRASLRERGVELTLDLVADYSARLRGGIGGSDAFRHLLSFGVALQSDLLLGWKGGTLFVGVQTANGRHGSDELTADLQGFDNIDSDGFTQISELWYEQTLLEEKVRLKVGKVDANSEFAYVENGAEFLNSSAGYSPTILGFATYPDPATSVNLFVYPQEWFYAGVGMYDGATQDGGFGRTGSRGPSTFWGEPSDLLLIGEAGVKWGLGEGAMPGRLGVGAWRHTGRFDRFDGGQESGTQGAYAVLDQRLWTENKDAPDEQGVGFFSQFGQADPDISLVSHHVSLGLTWTGAIPSRDADVLGLMISRVELTDRRGAGLKDNSETSIEAFYKFQITPWLSVKPDLQYILNPGGAGEGDALVATLRLEAAF